MEEVKQWAGHICICNQLHATMARQNLTLHPVAIVRPLMPPAFATQNTEARIMCSLVLEQWGRNQAVSLSLILDFIPGDNHTTHIVIILYVIMSYYSLKEACVTCLGMLTYTSHKTALEDIPNLCPTFWQSKT